MSLALPETAEKIEYALALVGLALIWRFVFSPRGRIAATRPALPAWDGDPIEFLIFLLFLFLGTYVGNLAGATLLKLHPLKGDSARLASGAGAQLGMLAGVVAFAIRSRAFRAHASIGLGRIFLSGVVTYLIILPLVLATNRAWELLLQLLNVPAEPQDLIRMFAEATSPRFIVGLTVLATVLAPITEEAVFRAGFFRFLRTRAPRMLALMLPALIFASLHVDWSSQTLEGFASFAPLFVLAIVFSVAYERTGHIGTTIVAHALFNLNTIALIFCGLRA